MSYRHRWGRYRQPIVGSATEKLTLVPVSIVSYGTAISTPLDSVKLDTAELTQSFHSGADSVSTVSCDAFRFYGQSPPIASSVVVGA